MQFPHLTHPKGTRSYFSTYKKKALKAKGEIMELQINKNNNNNNIWLFLLICIFL